MMNIQIQFMKEQIMLSNITQHRLVQVPKLKKLCNNE